jgi:hypothetical protein
MIVSGGAADGKVVTWNAASGERLGEAAAGSGVVALAALDGGRFVAGTKGGDVVLYKHHGGRGVEEAARIAGAHSHCVRDFAVCGGRLATASDDETAAVWSVDSHERLARLRGHTDCVRSVDMNDKFVATASDDKTVLVYSAEGDYSCTAVLDWLHTWRANSVTIVGADHILSASDDHTVCVTQLSSSTVVARTELSYFFYHATVLPDGRLAVYGDYGYAALFDAPAPAADILKAHGAAAFPEAAADASMLAVTEPLPPLQDAVVRVAVGQMTAAGACRELISAEACSVSLPEWSAGHFLLMQAIRDGDIPADRRYDGIDFYWVKSLYLPTRLLVLGSGDDHATVERFLLQAEAAGVIQSADAMVAAMAAHLDLRDNVNELRGAGEQILRAIAIIFVNQADMEQRLCSLERSRRVQQWALLANTILGLIPIAGASITCGIAGGVQVIDGLQTANIVESSLGAIIGALPDAADPLHKLFSRFLSTGTDLLREERTAEENELLEKIADGLGVPMARFQQILLNVQRRMEDRKHGGTSAAVEGVADAVSLVVVEEDDDADEKDDAENRLASAHTSDLDDVCGRLEGATMVELLPIQVSSACEIASTPDAACDSAGAVCATMGGVIEEHDAYQEAVATLLGAEVCEAEPLRFEDELHILKKRGVTADLVSAMAYKELAVSLAAHMVGYEHVWLSQFVRLRSRLMELFFEQTVSGSLLVGDHAIPPGKFLEHVVNGLNASYACRPTLGQEAALRRFISLLHGECQ